MNKNKTTVAFLLAAVGILAAMGCWFCWHCPSRVYGAHELFWRQLAWNGIGLAAFAGALLAGWKRLLKAAPWLMAIWLVAFAAAQCSCQVRGAHRWLPLGPVRINVMTCFMPVFALFAAWLHEKKWVRTWMELTAVAAAALWLVWHVAGNDMRMERLAAFFNPGDWLDTKAYMARQLQMAFDSANWFGGAGKSLGLLPCPESDGMMSAVALLFGKWFPVAVVGLFAVVGASVTMLWNAAEELSRRRFVLVFGLWLIAPAAYCLLHSLALLPVAGVSPALVGYGGNAAVMAWFGIGVVAAMARDGLSERSSDNRTVTVWRIVGAWAAAAFVAVVLIAFAPGRKCWTPGCPSDFAEPRPSDMEFGEFGLAAKRGRILAADGSPLAYTTRAWRFHVDPAVVSSRWPDPCHFAQEVACGFGMDVEKVKAAYLNTKSRYAFLLEADDGHPANEWHKRNGRLAREAGIVREPVQRRVYPLGEAASAVVGFMHDGRRTDRPRGAGGLEASCDKLLAGVQGVYDKRLPIDERNERAKPRPGQDVSTTIVPELQKAVAATLSAACATNGAESAWGIVMKVPSGEIAAMASWPSFDPSMQRTLDKWNLAMAVNHAARDSFELGGLMKPLTYAIALDAGCLSPDAKLEQGGGTWEYNGLEFKDSATNDLTIAEALSCGANIAAGKTALLVGKERFHAALRRFGFGTKTGVSGIPGEEVGILASSADRWDKTTAMRVGMGFGVAATGLQIVQAYSALANHGTLVRPVLVKPGATNAAVRAVSQASADEIVRMLKDGMPSTVQMTDGRTYSPTNYIASYVGFCPSERPEYIVAVSFAKPRLAHSGNVVARPVFNAIADRIANRKP